MKKKVLRNPIIYMYVLPTREVAPVEPLAMKFGNTLYLFDVIIGSKFGIDRYSSFALDIGDTCVGYL